MVFVVHNSLFSCFFLLAVSRRAADIFDVKYFRSKLAESYKRTATVPTSVWSKKSERKFEFHEIYTRLSWVKEEQTPAGSLRFELKHYTDVFAANENGVVPKRILVQGCAGIGKSTFVKKLAVDWAELDDATTGEKQKDILKKFEILVTVNLKEVSQCQTLMDVINGSSIFAREEKHLTDSLLNCITKNQEKVLLVLDGYDEYRCGSNSEIYEIFNGDYLRNCCVLITTQMSKANELRSSKVDMHAEITGFSKENRGAFMSKMLGSKAEAEELRRFLVRQNLEEFAEFPFLLLFFCTLWRKGKSNSFPRNKTKLYVVMVQYILYYTQGKDPPVCFGKADDSTEVLSEIGKVALECLFNSCHLFEDDQLPASIHSEMSHMSLIQVMESAQSTRPLKMVSFIHKSIQEFLAAWFVVHRCVPEGNLGEIEQHTRTLKDCVALQSVFQFICGLSDGGAVKVFQHLASVRTSDPTLDLSKAIQDEENETDMAPFDVIDRHVTFNDFVYDCLREVQSKAALARHWFDCLRGTVLVAPPEYHFLNHDPIVSIDE